MADASVALEIKTIDDQEAEQVGPTLRYFVYENGGFSSRTTHQGPTGVRISRSKTSHYFLTALSLGSFEMVELWDREVTEGREQEIINAMSILDSGIQNIHFLSGDSMMRHGGRSGIMVGYQGMKKRVPLGSFGDGTRRMLALSLALSAARGSVLMIDEIDTGLHYSVLSDMWKLIVRTAIDLDIQVFATTHSLDCIKGLAWLCDNMDDLASEVSLQKILPELEQSVAFHAEDISVAAEQDIEVR